MLLTIAVAIALTPASRVLAGDAKAPSAAAPPARPAASSTADTPAATTPSPALSFEWDGVFEAGKALRPGDYSRTVRPFGDWSQVCDDVRGGRHLCYLETVARHEGLSIGWRLARTRDGRSMALIILPRDASAQDGVTVEFGEMSRTAKPLICDKAVCVATFPVDGPMISLLARQKDARIYFRRDGNPVSIVAGLRGMEQALLDLTAKPIASPVATPRRTATTTAAVSATPKTKPTPSPWQGTR